MNETIRRFIRKQWKELRATVYFLLFVVVPIRSSVADWNWVPTGSMNPTILEGDLVYVNKAAYDLRVPFTLKRLHQWSNPKRGDMVVCFSPDDSVRLVKRVIAVPGDSIEMRNNRLIVNGQPLEYRPAQNEATRDLPADLKRRSVAAEEDLFGKRHNVLTIPSILAVRDFSQRTLPEGDYFVMGDNRDNSKDSRFFGFVQRSSIIGEVKGVILSLNKLDRYQPRWRRFFSPID